MSAVSALTRRNAKVFFKDKGMFFSSLITPIILLILYITFLGSVYRDSFSSNLPLNFAISEDLINATVAGQLVSSLLAVSCVTVAFCSNLLMISDKVTGARKDLTVTPVRKSQLALSYYLASAFATLIVCFTAMIACFIYLANVGWYLTASDVAFVCLDIILLVLFGTTLSSIINFPLTTNGQASAVGTIVSAGYGFICGAYMPISNFSDGLQKALSFLPGTYGTSLIKNHMMAGVYREMKDVGFPSEVIELIKDSIDCNVYFFGDKVSVGAMYTVMAVSICVLLAVFILMNVLKKSEN